jgi:hypothetical protein
MTGVSKIDLMPNDTTIQSAARIWLAAELLEVHMML